MESIIVTSANDLRTILREVILEANTKTPRKEPKALDSDYLDPSEAVVFLKSLGYSTTVKSLYNKVFNNKIPSLKIAGKRVFSKKELTQWVEGVKEHSTTPQERAAEDLAKNIYGLK